MLYLVRWFFSEQLKNKGLWHGGVIPSGLEPETVCLEGRCSIQLSYGTFCELFRKAKFGRESESRSKNCGSMYNSSAAGHLCPNKCPL